MNCPKCNNATSVACRGKRYAVYPSGCLVLLGPVLAILHQASSPVDYECGQCGHTFKRRSVPARIALYVILAFLLFYLVQAVADFVAISRLQEPPPE